MAKPTGLTCPHCEGPTKILEVSPSTSRADQRVGGRLRRRRKCDDCGQTFSTIEILSNAVPTAPRRRSEHLHPAISDNWPILRELLADLLEEALANKPEGQTSSGDIRQPMPTHRVAWDESVQAYACEALEFWGRHDIAQAVRARSQVGLATYGTYLGWRNGRDSRQDLEDEILDAIAYSFAAMESQAMMRDEVVQDLIKVLDRVRKNE
jgi:hypothetical protein